MFDQVVSDIRKLFKPEPIHHVVNERAYEVIPTEDGPKLGSLIIPPAKPTLQLSSLSGFLDAFAVQIDDFAGDAESPAKTAVHVIDYRTVALISLEADDFGRRHEWVRATNTEENPFPFDTYQTPEMFLINLQSGFLPTENVISLQRLVSSLNSENSIGTQDDGLSQTITVKEGNMVRTAVELPPRIPLHAYRSFRELEPVESEFMLRLKGKTGELPTVALRQIDAGKWKHDTQLHIREYLRKSLPETAIVIA